MPYTSPWVSIFSRFTSEALLFEALVIFSLIAIYTGFWLVRKRKFGVIENQVPAGVVKYYLNELIVDAEQLRAQLFGMLTGHGVPATPLANLNFTGSSAGTFVHSTTSPSAGGASLNPEALASLEQKIAQQAQQIENFTAEKNRIETELKEAKASKGAAVAGGDAGALAKLQEKIAILEGKLAEYSVIEDDLANLKRLQQENASLRAQLAALGAKPAIAAAASAATPAAAEAPAEETAAAGGAVDTEKEMMEALKEAETPAAEAVAAAPAELAPAEPASPSLDEIAAVAEAADAVAEVATPGAPELAEPVAAAEAGTLEGGFEGLVDQVEQSLQPEKTAAPAEAKKPSSTTAPAKANIEKSDADLISEFEKMLNG